MPVTCTDGTTANTLEECPQLVDYQADVGYEAQGEFFDDPTTTDIDESMQDIYLAVGGSDWTGQTLQEFTAEYGADFPTWAGSEYGKQSDLIESKLGMLPDLMDLSKRGLDLESDTTRFQAGTELEGIQESREAMIRAGGGLKTGQSEDKVQSAYDRVLSGFDLQQEGIDIKRESSLFDFEGRRLDYQMDLSMVKQDYQDSMWDLITSDLDKYKSDETLSGSDIDALDAENVAVVMTCIEKCDDAGADPGCKAACRDSVDDDTEGNQSLIDDIALANDPWTPDVELDPAGIAPITQQACIDQCIDEGGNPSGCRQSCSKSNIGADDDDSDIILNENDSNNYTTSNNYTAPRNNTASGPNLTDKLLSDA